MTTVSQEAREAAAALIDKHGRSKDWTPTNIRLGNLDDLPTVQAFAKFERDTLARHRLERSEPVGWMYVSENGKRRAFSEDRWAPHIVAEIGATEHALHTTPPEPVAEIERLRDELNKARGILERLRDFDGWQGTFHAGHAYDAKQEAIAYLKSAL